MFSRFRSAARILVKGELKKKQRNPIPSITLEEVAEIKQFFPRKIFHLRSCPLRDDLAHAPRAAAS